MSKEIHFNSVSYDDNTLITYDETLRAIKKEEPYIETVQMALLSTDLIKQGYKVFVRDADGEYEITLGGGCDRTAKELRIAHNIERMWKAGSFDL